MKWRKEYAKGPKEKGKISWTQKRYSPHPNIFSLQQQQHFSVASPLSHTHWANNNISEFWFLTRSQITIYIYLYIKRNKTVSTSSSLSLSLSLSLEPSLSRSLSEWNSKLRSSPWVIFSFPSFRSFSFILILIVRFKSNGFQFVFDFHFESQKLLSDFLFFFFFLFLIYM